MHRSLFLIQLSYMENKMVETTKKSWLAVKKTALYNWFMAGCDTRPNAADYPDGVQKAFEWLTRPGYISKFKTWAWSKLGAVWKKLGFKCTCKKPVELPVVRP
jgi:hypothetical protein